MEARHITVVGGANTDVCGAPFAPLVRRDSNPGRVSVRLGGVGRNIAQDLRLLGMEVSLVTALGGDLFGASLAESCRAAGIDMSMSLTVPGERSSVYLCIGDGRGEMDAAVSDMDVTARITPEHLARHIARINASDAVVADANLSAESLAFLAENCRVPLYADAVSAAKAPKLRPILASLAAIKPNLLEARALTGADSAEDCASALLERGVGRVFVSLGAEGLLAASASGRALLPCLPCRVVNTTGAGDAAAAAVVWAGALGLGLVETARAALCAGALTSSCEETNSPLLCAETLLRAAGV